jgi:hypothetical protein
MVVNETSIGPVFSTMKKDKDFLIEGGSEPDRDFVNGDYPVIDKIKVDSEAYCVDR